MPFVAHSKDAYVLALHHFYCLGKSAAEASEATGINATVIERAASGWTHGRDGRVGRAIFIWWTRGLRSSEGAPCCGAKVHPGKRKPPVLGPPEQEMRKLQELEEALRTTRAEVERIRRAWGLTELLAGRDAHVGTHETPPKDDDDSSADRPADATPQF